MGIDAASAGKVGEGLATAGALRADLVLEGGGVRGLGLVGAVATLAEAGYFFPRVAGTSAGALLGAVLAGLQAAGEPPGRIVDVADTLDVSKFADSSLIDRLLGPFGPVAGLLFDDGLFEGRYLRDWIAGVLGDLGVTTFGDLRITDDPGTALPPDRQYRLVVTVSDLSRRSLTRLPWDAAEYGVDPDELPVADAVRASAAIPFFYEPSHLGPGGFGDTAGSTLVDGGLLSNYPIGLFDRGDGHDPRWPTLGVRLSSRAAVLPRTRTVGGPLSETAALVATLWAGAESRHIDEPCTVARTVFVDASTVSPVDFEATAEQLAGLRAAGRAAAGSFLAGWEYGQWRAACG